MREWNTDIWYRPKLEVAEWFKFPVTRHKDTMLRVNAKEVK
jgi:hypothetical protein